MPNHKNAIKVLVTRDFPDTAIELLIREGFKVTTRLHDALWTQKELIEAAKEHNALLCTITEKINAEFLNACNHLDIVSQYAVGYDNIDVAEATRLKIPIGYTPDVLTDATADIAFALMIATARKLLYAHKLILKGEWDYFRPKRHLGLELKGKILGIYGLGRIGYAMAEKCKGAYNMEILYCNRNPHPEAEDTLGAKRVSFEELLKQSDVLSAHCALNDETKGKFDLAAFKQMKPTAIFINTARGLVHNEADLKKALDEGIIWGAGLDVTNPEPMGKENPLLGMETVTVLPHMGSSTAEARDAMSRLAATNIIEFYKSGKIPHCVNGEVLD